MSEKTHEETLEAAFYALLKVGYKEKEPIVFPVHPMLSSWRFLFEEQEEAILAAAMAILAEKNGMNQNDLMHLYPAVLRMLKSNSRWTK